MKIEDKNPYIPEAQELMDELSGSLESVTGNSGRESFNIDDVCDERGIFVIAYDDDGKAIGCGAIRHLNGSTAEVKRMYARVKGMGTGTEILNCLEKKAERKGYTVIRLETRLINQKAVEFYEKRGYKRIDNYGKYAGNPDAVCFEKLLNKSGERLW